MFCIKCGEKLPEDTKFCYKCGNEVASSLGDGVVSQTANIPERTAMHEPAKPMPRQTPSMPVPVAVAPMPYAKKPQGNRSKFIGIGIVAVVLLVAIVIFTSGGDDASGIVAESNVGNVAGSEIPQPSPHASRVHGDFNQTTRFDNLGSVDNSFTPPNRTGNLYSR